MAESKVEPERGRPEMKCMFRPGFDVIVFAILVYFQLGRLRHSPMTGLDPSCRCGKAGWEGGVRALAGDPIVRAGACHTQHGVLVPFFKKQKLPASSDRSAALGNWAARVDTSKIQIDVAVRK
jgi:hypothetical protein